MTVIWIVSKDRFVQEYKNHVAPVATKYVNWFVNSQGLLTAYIFASHSNEMYCYRVSKDDIPNSVKDFISPKGMVLGVVDNNEEVSSGLVELSSQLTQIQFQRA